MDNCPGVLSRTKTTTLNTTSGASDLAEYLITSAVLFQQELADAWMVRNEIALFGFGVSFAISWTFIIFMQFCAAIVVWSIVFGVWAIFVLATACL